MAVGARTTPVLAPIAVLVAALVAAGCSATGDSNGIARGSAAPGAPNLIVIVTDDQTAAEFSPRTMPNTHRFLADEGVAFRNAIVTTPLCCPSRAAFLTGQYGHNNGVVSNTYLKLRDKQSVLPSWLQHAGYETSHVGKYLNNYAKSLDDPAAATPGWDRWFTVLEPENYGNYSISDDGKVAEYGWKPREHLTRALNDRAVEEVRRLGGKRKPFYLQLDHYAPHGGKGNSGGGCPGGAAPERRDRAGFANELPPERESFGAAAQDKSSFLRDLPPIEKRETERIRARWRCALQALAGVDRGVGRIVHALRKAGELDDTAIVFTSDNGYFFGEHRLTAGKHFPYEEAIRVPLVIRPPRGTDVARGSASDAPVANIDLAPTLLDLASGTPCIRKGRCRRLDGRSLVSLMSGAGSGWPAARPLLVEIDLPPSNESDWPRPCTYRAVRTAGHVYINYTSGGAAGKACEEIDEEELYSLADDPQQTSNLIAVGRPGDRRLAARMRELAIELEQCRGRAPAPGGCP